jgi:hypothetical protein
MKGNEKENACFSGGDPEGAGEPAAGGRNSDPIVAPPNPDVKRRIDNRDVIAVLREFAGQANTLTIPRLFVRLLGSLDSALFLNQLVFWSDKGSRPDGFIWKSRKEWAEELTLTDYAIRKATEQLEKMGLLETKLLKANAAPTLHYRLDLGALYEELVELVNPTNGFVEIDKSDLLKSTNPRFVEINKSITEEHHNNTQHDGDGVLDLVKGWGIHLTPEVKRLVSGYNCTQLECAWERAQGGHSPAALFVHFLRDSALMVPALAGPDPEPVNLYPDHKFCEICGWPIWPVNRCICDPVPDAGGEE